MPTSESGPIRKDEEGERIAVTFWFAQQMLVKLRIKSGKGDWGALAYDQIMSRINDEFRELRHVVDLYETYHRHATFADNIQRLEGIIDECRDIANFAMFAADNAKTSIDRLLAEEAEQP